MDRDEWLRRYKARLIERGVDEAVAEAETQAEAEYEGNRAQHHGLCKKRDQRKRRRREKQRIGQRLLLAVAAYEQSEHDPHHESRRRKGPEHQADNGSGEPGRMAVERHVELVEIEAGHHHRPPEEGAARRRISHEVHHAPRPGLLSFNGGDRNASE